MYKLPRFVWDNSFESVIIYVFSHNNLIFSFNFLVIVCKTISGYANVIQIVSCSTKFKNT